MDELSDRFSPPPESVVNLMRISLVRNMARGLGVTDIKQKSRNLVFFFDNLDSQTVYSLHCIYGKDLMYTPGQRPYITLRTGQQLQVIELMEDFLNNLKKSAQQ